MRVIFIYSLDDVQSLLKPIRSWSDMQFGISYISSLLKSKGHETQLLVLGSNNKRRSNINLLKNAFSRFHADLVCLTAVASQFSFIKDVGFSIKRFWPSKYLIIGGVHATLNPNQVIDGPFDAVCIGEGEYPTLEICNQLEDNKIPHAIKNLWIKNNAGQIEKNNPRPFEKDIDVFSFPDREIWTPWIKEQLGSELAVLLGRGCPYSCTYCCNHALKKVAMGKYVRFRSPENILEEIKSLHASIPTLSRIYFEVESIALDKPWLFKLCTQLKEYNLTINKSISYGCNYRISPQSIDKQVFYFLKAAGFTKVNIGLESGSERIRRKILKRNYSNKDFLDVIAMAREVGLKVCVFNILGLPGETYSDYMETVSLNRQCQPDKHYTGIFFPYPGTEIYDRCVREGLITLPINQRLERRKPVTNLPGFTRSQIQRAHTWFDFRIYKGHKPFCWRLMQTIMVKVRSNITANYLLRKIVQWPLIQDMRFKLSSME